jgi:hypothetical protein
MEKYYILVDPNDDSGNDDGILDKMKLTYEEAERLNDERRKRGNDCRWVLLNPPRATGISHHEDVDPGY